MADQQATAGRKVVRAELTQFEENRLDYSGSATENRTRDIQQRLEALEKRLSTRPADVARS